MNSYLSDGPDKDSLKEVDKVKSTTLLFALKYLIFDIINVIFIFIVNSHLAALYCVIWLATSRNGWKTLIVPEDDEQYKVVHFELHGVQNNIQARQVEILGQPDKPALIPVQLLLFLCKKIVKQAFRSFILLTYSKKEN